jgi:hypothetical protein
VANARRLSPTQRQAVGNGQRPLVLPRAAPANPPIPPVVPSPRERLDELVADVGFDNVLTMLVAAEKTAA